MAWTFVQGAKQDPAAANPAVTVTPTVGNLMVVMAPRGASNPASPSSISDTAGNTWNNCVNPFNDDTHGDSIRGWWAIANGSSSTTITVNSQGDLAAIAYAEYTPPATPSADGDIGAVHTDANGTDGIQGGPITTTVNGDLVVALAFGASAAEAPGAAGTGWTSRATASNPAPALFGWIWEDQEQAVAGSITPTWTANLNPHDFTSFQMAFQAAAGGAAPVGSPWVE